MGQQVNVGRELHFEPGAIVTGSWNGSYDVGGKTYYVNNITGNATADGLSWNNPCDQVSTAIALSEASRLVHPGTTTNDYIANRIVIQATGTAYTKITDTGERCYIIGLSAGLHRDGGSGQVRIGSSTDDGCKDETGHSRGNTWYNMQFQFGGSGKHGFYITNYIQRSRFQDMVFMQAGTGGTNNFYAGYMTGSIMERCLFTDNQGGVRATYGFQVNGQFSDDLITDCVFAAGKTALVILGSGSHQVNSVITKCHFFPTGNTAVAVGFDDNSADGYCMLAGNYFATTDLLTDQISRAINYRTCDNWSASADTPIDS